MAPDVVSMPLSGGLRRRQAPALQIAINWIPQVARQAMHRMTTPGVHRRSVDTMAAVDLLRVEQGGQTEKLAQLRGCSFPKWTTLYGSTGLTLGALGGPSIHSKRIQSASRSRPTSSDVNPGQPNGVQIFM